MEKFDLTEFEWSNAGQGVFGYNSVGGGMGGTITSNLESGYGMQQQYT